MQYNRKLLISTAGRRKAFFWPESAIMWSDFADRLRVPVRSTETIDQYAAFPKSRQAELKDVGGFVGGTFENGRRKSAYVRGRDLLTLDLDNIPAGKTEDKIGRAHV